MFLLSRISQIYLSLEGVDQEKIQSDFKPMSFDIKLHDVQGKNYRCAIPKLHKEIVPEKCKILVKPNRVVITLVKASKGNWLDLHFKEDKVIASWNEKSNIVVRYFIYGFLWPYCLCYLQLKPNLDKERGDPMAGIMDLMKVEEKSFSCYIGIGLNVACLPFVYIISISF